MFWTVHPYPPSPTKLTSRASRASAAPPVIEPSCLTDALLVAAECDDDTADASPCVASETEARACMGAGASCQPSRVYPVCGEGCGRGPPVHSLWTCRYCQGLYCETCRRAGTHRCAIVE